MKKNIYTQAIEFAFKHSLLVIIVTCLTTIFFLYFAVQIKFNPDFNSLLPADDQSNIDFIELYNNGDFTDNFIVMLTGDDLYSPECLTQMQIVVDKIEAYENIGNGIHPFSFITASKKGSRLSVNPINIKKIGETWDQQDADLLKMKLTNDEIAKNLFVSGDGTSILLYFPAIVLTDDNSAQMLELKEIVEPLKQFAEVSLNGGILFTDSIMFYLQKDLILLLVLCFFIIMLIYYLSFHSKRAVILPMTVVVFGTIWCLGIVSILGYDLTIINIITPVLVLTLGSSYSIHLLNEYYRTHPNKLGNGGKKWIVDAVSHISRTVIIAGITTIAGFLSLLITRIPEFRQFGVSTSIGILSSVILTLFYLPAVLCRLPNPKEHYYKLLFKGRISQILKVLAGFVVRRWAFILLFFCITIAAFIYAYPQVEFETSYVQYFPEEDDAITGLKKMVDRIGGMDAIYITVDAPEDAERYFLDPDILKVVDKFETEMRNNVPEITHILSFSTYVKFFNSIMNDSSEIPETKGLIMLLSRYMGLISQNSIGNSDLELLIDSDANRITIAFRYTNQGKSQLADLQDSQAVINAIENYTVYLPTDCTYTIWGQSKRFIALSELIESDQRNSTILSLLVVFIIAWITFKSAKYGFLSLFPIIFGIMTNFIFMFLLNIPFDMVTIAFASVTVGVGIDDAVHFILRFKSLYFYRSGSLLPAVKRTIELTGRPIMLTTFSIIGGVLVLTMASFVPIRYFGVLISLALFNTLLATLFILPSGLILWIGTQRAIEKRKIRKRARTQNRNRNKIQTQALKIAVDE